MTMVSEALKQGPKGSRFRLGGEKKKIHRRVGLVKVETCSVAARGARGKGISQDVCWDVLQTKVQGSTPSEYQVDFFLAAAATLVLLLTIVGFIFRNRRPAWIDHRFLVCAKPGGVTGGVSR